MIWEYLIAVDGVPRKAYGTPVEVFVRGVGPKTLVYQFGDGVHQDRGVVDLRSGLMVAPIAEHAVGPAGCPRTWAQRAVDARTATMSEETIRRAFEVVDPLNAVPKIVGTYR